MNTCSIEGCSRAMRSKGLCNAHYKRLRCYGDPLKGWSRSPHNAPRDYLYMKVIGYEGDDCLIWPYGKNKRGYGQISNPNGSNLVHRIICELVHGQPPTPKHHAAHSCGNGHLGCVAPKHLSWETHDENMADMIAHGTSPAGERNSNSKLTTAQVLDIRRMYDANIHHSAIAQEYGISTKTVSKIGLRLRWRHLYEAAR